MATDAAVKNNLAQRKMAAMAHGTLTGDIIFVDSNNGDNGNSGLEPRNAVKTLTRALALAAAGDTIILGPGGAETVTATLAVNMARVRIICPADNPLSGFAITGAGSVDLMTVSAADVYIKGLTFKRTAAAGAATAGILTTAAADRLMVEGCGFDYTDLTGTFSNYGIEITDACDGVVVKDCLFKDAHRSVLLAQTSGVTMEGIRIEGCEFWVGQSTAFGLHASSAGNQVGVLVKDCIFYELDGDGTSATDAWDGTDGTDAASGPMSLGANVDGAIVTGCVSYNASNVSFAQDCTVASGATVSLIGNKGKLDADMDKTKERLVIKASGSMASGWGTGDSPVSLFTVTGDVAVRVVGVVSTAVTSTSANGTLALGTAENTGGIIAASTANGTQFALTDVWVDSSPANDAEQMTEDWVVIGGGADIVATIATNNMTAGGINFYCYWKPLSDDGNVVAA